MCLTGAVVASWTLTQEVAGPNPFYCNDKYFILLLNSTKIQWKHLGENSSITEWFAMKTTVFQNDLHLNRSNFYLCI